MVFFKFLKSRVGLSGRGLSGIRLHFHLTAYLGISDACQGALSDVSR